MVWNKKWPEISTVPWIKKMIGWHVQSYIISDNQLRKRELVILIFFFLPGFKNICVNSEIFHKKNFVLLTQWMHSDFGATCVILTFNHFKSITNSKILWKLINIFFQSIININFFHLKFSSWKKKLKYKGDKSTDPHLVKPTGIKLILYWEFLTDIAIPYSRTSLYIQSL